MAVIRESATTFEVGKRADINQDNLLRVLDLADRTLSDFINSFEVETDFNLERKNMKRFSRLVGSDSAVYVPRVFDKQSGREVLTMQFIDGDGLNDYVTRVNTAEAARKQPRKKGALPESKNLVKRAVREKGHRSCSAHLRLEAPEPQDQAHRPRGLAHHRSLR